MAIFNILKPLAEKLKYWDISKRNKVDFQNKPSVKKSGISPSDVIAISNACVLVLLKLKWPKNKSFYVLFCCDYLKFLPRLLGVASHVTKEQSSWNQK